MKYFYKFIKTHKNIAIIAALGWSLFYTLNMAAAKAINPFVFTSTLLFWRSVFVTVLLIPLILRNRNNLIKTRFIKIHILRSILMALAVYLTYTAYRKLPLTLATSIGFTAPLIMTLLSLLFLKENISWRKWTIILLGYIGMIIIVRPSVVPFDIHILYSLGANISACLGLLLVKKIAQEDKPEVIIFFPNFIMLIITSIIAHASWQAIDNNSLILIFLIAILASLGQYAYVVAVRHAQASFVAPFEYLRIVLALPIGLYAFEERLDIFMVIGLSIIILSTWMLSRLSRKEVI